MLRLQKKHSRLQADTSPGPDATLILAQQSIGKAIAAGVLAALLFGWAWAMLSIGTGRVFPWLTIVMGMLVGLAVQRYGRGLDWRFAVTSALIAWIGAYAGNLTIAIVATGQYIDAAPLRVFVGLSQDTMKNFFANTVGPVDHVYALCAAGVAAFFAKRRLKRREVHAIRTTTGEKV